MTRALGAAVCWAAWIAIGCGAERSTEYPNERSRVRGASAAVDASASAGGDAASPASEADGGPTGADCEALGCEAPATCSAEDGDARCVCPDGYRDVDGDGRSCQDEDECKAGADECSRRSECVNTPGGYTCRCRAPAYVGEGESCECAEGYLEVDGLCLLDNRGACEDDLDCASGHCVGGSCCADACSAPEEDCRTLDTAHCDDGTTCVYGVAKDGAECTDADACSARSICVAGVCMGSNERTSCDDGNPCTDDSCDASVGCRNVNNSASCDDGNPCTEGDQCTAGTCSEASARDCSAEADSCNAGACDPASGACRKQPLADGTPCDDASSCSLEDVCQAGSCLGQGNACGPSALACAPGAPNTCTCPSDFLAVEGACRPVEDECAQDPCSPDADCVDPDNAANTVVCTCRAGFTGDGLECAALDPCEGDPCGAGSCRPGAAGSHSCGCDAGHVEVDGRCVCDLSGAFALRTSLAFSWAGIPRLEDGSDETASWAIARNTYDASGQLTMELQGCGDTASELCGTGLPPLVAAEAYVQYLPVEIWAQPSMPVTRVQMPLVEPLPGARFDSPDIAVVLGVSLTDPLGAWPASRADIQGGPDYDGSAVNGARWIDADDDGSIGVTNYTVPPGGLPIDGVAPDPVAAFAASSRVCPRGSQAERLPYNHPPAPEGLTVRRIKRVYTASRVITALRGALDSCEVIRGSVVGPNDGQAQVDARIGGCVRVDGDAERACSTGPIDFLDDDEAQRQRVASGRFIMRRVADDITCAEVRTLAFD